jgi:hypothetical protein
MSMSQNLNVCNVTVDGQQYYDSDSSRASRFLQNAAGMGWEFLQFTWCGGCCVCLMVILAIMSASSANKMGLGIMASIVLLCCCCSSYHYYGYTSYKSSITNDSAAVKTSPSSRPCKDNTNGQIYTR